MINSCRTWLIFPIWNISNLVLDGIYFPILSVKISIHNIIGGIWHHCYCCSTPTKCLVHYGYCHICFCIFNATLILGILQIRVFKGVRSIYLLQVPCRDFYKGCKIAQIINKCFTHLSIKDL